MEILDGKIAAGRVDHLAADEAQIVTAIGLRGTGKTFFLRHYSATREPRRLSLDRLGDFSAGSEVYRENWRLGLERLATQRRAMWVRLVPPKRQGFEAWADEVFTAILERETPDGSDFQWDMLIVMDEAHRYGLQRVVATSPLAQAVLEGRHHGLRWLIGAQRMVDLPASILNETTDLAVFEVTSPRDRKRLAEWTEEDAEDLVRELPPFHCLLWSPLGHRHKR